MTSPTLTQNKRARATLAVAWCAALWPAVHAMAGPAPPPDCPEAQQDAAWLTTPACAAQLLLTSVASWNSLRAAQPSAVPALAGADLSRAALSGADLHRANLKGARLASADLQQANLAGADLAGVDLSGALLSEADLSGTDVTGVKLDGIQGVVAKQPQRGFVLVQGRCPASCTDKAWLQDQACAVQVMLLGARPWNELRDRHQVEIQLEGVSLAEAELSGIDLSGVLIFSAEFSGANLSGAKLQRAWLSGASLAQANLDQADLSEATVHGTDLTGASLKGTRLAKASVRLSDFTNANLSGVVATNASFINTLGADGIPGVTVSWVDLDGTCLEEGYQHDESKNASGLGRCANDCDCNSRRTCSPAGQCQGIGGLQIVEVPNVVPDPLTPPPPVIHLDGPIR